MNAEMVILSSGYEHAEPVDTRSEQTYSLATMATRKHSKFYILGLL